MRKIFGILSLVSLLGLLNTSAYAETFGVADLDRIVSEYSKTQEISADLRVKEAELQKFIAESQKKVKEAKTPLERTNLERTLGAEIDSKAASLQDEQAKQWKIIEQNVFGAIQNVAQEQKTDIILNKAVVIYGGMDITDNTINILNKGYQSSPAKTPIQKNNQNNPKKNPPKTSVK